MYLLDTDVIAELRKRRPSASVIAWLTDLEPQEIALPAIAIGEIAIGIERARESDPQKAAELNDWLDDMRGDYPVLPATPEIYRLWARLMHTRQPHDVNNALIAATALQHGLTVATRGTKEFLPFGVLVTNPFRARRAP